MEALIFTLNLTGRCPQWGHGALVDSFLLSATAKTYHCHLARRAEHNDYKTHNENVTRAWLKMDCVLRRQRDSRVALIIAKSASAANRCSRRWIRRFKWLKASYRSHYCTTEPAVKPSALWSVHWGFSVNTRHINFANRWNKNSRKVGSGLLTGWMSSRANFTFCATRWNLIKQKLN